MPSGMEAANSENPTMPTTLKRFLLDTYGPLKQLSTRTVTLYCHSIDRFADCLGREPTLDDLNDLAVSQFIAWRLETPHRGKIVRRTTVRKDRAQLLSLAGLAFRKGLIQEDVVLPPFRAAGRLPVAYTKEELGRMITEADVTRGRVAGIPAGEWHGTLLRFLWETACRIGETLAVEWQNVDLDGRRVLLPSETRKLKTRDLVRQISPALADRLRGRQEASGRVWPWDRPKESLWLAFGQICKRADVQPRGFHSIRKSAASYYAAAGGNPVDLLDHSDGGELYQQHYRDQRIAGTGPAAIEILPSLEIPGSAPDQSNVNR